MLSPYSHANLQSARMESVTAEKPLRMQRLVQHRVSATLWPWETRLLTHPREISLQPE